MKNKWRISLSRKPSLWPGKNLIKLEQDSLVALKGSIRVEWKGFLEGFTIGLPFTWTLRAYGFSSLFVFTAYGP